MLPRKHTLLNGIGLLWMILAVAVIPVNAFAEAFRPEISFHGSILVTADMYFGQLPDDKVDLDNPEDIDLRKMFQVTNPSTPGFQQSNTLRFYANPVEDLEMNLTLNFNGRWGGWGTSVYLESPLYLREAFARYYMDWGMLTVGRFSYDFDAFNLLLSCQNSARDGVILHTMVADTWITGVYNRLMMSMYRDYPYTSTLVLDDLAALRVSRKVGNHLIGLNLLFDGFDDEYGASIDFSGKLFGRPLKAELAVIRPYEGLRHKTDDGGEGEAAEEEEEEEEDSMIYLGESCWPGMLISYDAYETKKDLLTVRVGAFGKGFYPQYGLRAESSMESEVKFYHNTYGVDLFYQRVLAKDLLLGVNAVCLDFVNKEYQEKLKFRIPTRRLELKLTKFLSSSSTVALTTGYMKQNEFDYGRAGLEWGFHF